MSINNLVSVIMIFFNEEKYIEEAVKSVFKQSCPNWELIFVDDGSTDNSVKIAKYYAGLYPQKVKYLEHSGHQNLGMSASRNLGIINSSGRYVTFLDADDVWLPGKLEHQISILNSNPDAAMVYGRTQIWYSWTENSEDLGRDHFYDLGVISNKLINPPDLFLVMLQNKFQSPTTCNAMIRRTVFDNVGMFEKNFQGMYEDQVFFAKVLLKLPVFVSDQVWAKYRQHPESCNQISENNGNYFSTRLPFLKWLSGYLTRQGINEKSDVWKAFQKELWLCTHPGANYFISKYKHLKNRLMNTQLNHTFKDN